MLTFRSGDRRKDGKQIDQGIECNFVHLAGGIMIQSNPMKRFVLYLMIEAQDKLTRKSLLTVYLTISMRSFSISGATSASCLALNSRLLLNEPIIGFIFSKMGETAGSAAIISKSI